MANLTTSTPGGDRRRARTYLSARVRSYDPEPEPQLNYINFRKMDKDFKLATLRRKSSSALVQPSEDRTARPHPTC